MADPPSNTHISMIIWGLRHEGGYTQKEVSEGTGLTTTQLSNIEQKVTLHPHRSTLQKLANFFRTPLPRIEGSQKIWIHPEEVGDE